MVKAGYKNAIQGTASVWVSLDRNGYIAQEDDTVVSSKTINFTTVNADNVLAQNETIAQLFLVTFAGGTYTRESQSMKVTWQV